MSARQHIREGRKALPLDLIAQAIPMLSRHELAALADRLIDAIDSAGGDTDLEAEEDCCAAADDGAGPVIVHGFKQWGSDHDETRHLPKCIYAEDQRIVVLNQQYGGTLNVDDYPSR